MKVANIGKDFVIIDENNLEDFKNIEKVHLIKFNFSNPELSLVEKVLREYPNTNRFVISNNIKFYNDILKTTNKKYYVENFPGAGLITFFRKNNKVLLNFEILTKEEKKFIFDNIFEDILKNVEVILISKEDFNNKQEVLQEWRGNVIIK